MLSDAINIMQDHITRTRLAGGPPHVILMPRLGDTGLTEFNRAKQAIGESRACVEQAMPMLQRYISKRRQRAVRDEKQSTGCLVPIPRTALSSNGTKIHRSRVFVARSDSLSRQTPRPRHQK